MRSQTSPTKLEKDGNGKITLSFKSNDGEEGTLAGVDTVLFATGRAPNTKGIGLEELGVELDPKGGIKASFQLSAFPRAGILHASFPSIEFHPFRPQKKGGLLVVCR